VPAIADGLDPGVLQLHSSAYRRPDDLPPGRVLVVGGGNTGFQIADELADSHEVHLSIGSRQMPLPQRIAGRDLFWYLEASGLMGKNTDTRLGRRMQARDALIGSSPRAIRRRGVQIRPRTTAVSGPTVTFDDGTALTVSTVIWATGFGLDHSWIHVPVFDDLGRVTHRRGVTAASGLYFLGMPWQHTRGSALLGWVKDDARHLAQHISTLQGTRPAPVPA
jgi:putative flavoprotein involved in K+ transport